MKSLARKLEMYVKSSKVGRGYRLDLPQDAGSWQMKRLVVGICDPKEWYDPGGAWHPG